MLLCYNCCCRRCKRPKLLVLAGMLARRRRQQPNRRDNLCAFEDVSQEALDTLERYGPQTLRCSCYNLWSRLLIIVRIIQHTAMGPWQHALCLGVKLARPRTVSRQVVWQAGLWPGKMEAGLDEQIMETTGSVAYEMYTPAAPGYTIYSLPA